MTGSEAVGQYNVTVSGGRGVYIGDHGIQVNLFTGEPPPGPVVAGNVPQAPPAYRPREDLMAALRWTRAGRPRRPRGHRDARRRQVPARRRLRA